jgi:hypothetical protein
MKSLILVFALAASFSCYAQATQRTDHRTEANTDKERVVASSVRLTPVASKKVCCLSRESVDSGRRIGPVYRVRDDSCNKGEETVEMKFCKGP